MKKLLVILLFVVSAVCYGESVIKEFFESKKIYFNLSLSPEEIGGGIELSEDISESIEFGGGAQIKMIKGGRKVPVYVFSRFYLDLGTELMPYGKATVGYQYSKKDEIKSHDIFANLGVGARTDDFYGEILLNNSRKVSVNGGIVF